MRSIDTLMAEGQAKPKKERKPRAKKQARVSAALIHTASGATIRMKGFSYSMGVMVDGGEMQRFEGDTVEGFQRDLEAMAKVLR